MPPVSRSTKLAVVLVAAASAVSGATVAASEDERPQPVKISFEMPSGRAGELSVRGDEGPSSAWCGKAVVERGGRRPAEREDCGGAPGRGLHGPFLADCARREAIVFGSVRSGVTISQARRGRPRLVARTGPRPRGVDFDGRFYAVGVDLAQRRPVLRATDSRSREVGRYDFSDEARRCREGGLGIVGGM